MKALLKLNKESKRPHVERREWMDSAVMELATAETLPGIIDRCIESGLYALDLETTGLDNRVFDGVTKDKIVGACLSPDGKHGYYVPVRHRGEGEKHNIPVSLFESEMRRLANSEARAIFHKGKFDQEFLQFCGGEPMGEWDDPAKWEDTLILAYLYNTRLPRVGLKYLAEMWLNPEAERNVIRRRNGEKVLGYMIELEELYPPDHKKKDGYNYADLDPSWEPCVWYAAGDAICTYRLFEYLYEKVVKPESGPSQKTVYQIEKMCAPATRWMERCRVHIDLDKVAELIRLGQREYFESIKAVYDFCAEACGRDIAPAWWHVLMSGVTFEGDKENTPPVFNPDDVEQDIRQQITEAKKIVDHNTKRPAWDRSEPLAAIDARAKEKVQKQIKGETKDYPYQYDVLSAQQLGGLFEEMEVPDLRYTEKSGQVMTTAAEMDRLTELHGDTYPFMKRIKRMREVQKALSSYLLPLRSDTSKVDHTLRIDYNGWKVDTGRFATPKDNNPERNGGTSLSMHGLPSGYDPNRPECLRRVRETVRARDGRIMAAVDFSGVELRIVTNLSREPLWIAEFFRCSSCNRTFDRGDGKTTPDAPPPFCPRCGSDKIGDLHTLSAISFYGEESQKTKEFKQLRQRAKSSNFALCYGGSGKAVVRATGVEDNEGWRIYRQFTGTYKGLQAWWKKQHAYAKEHGYVITAFGRRYPVPDINLPRRDPKTGRDNGAFIAKSERNAVNGPIQGCLHPDSRIHTSLGLLRIEELHDQGEPFDVWTGTSWEKARVFPSGLKKVRATTFDSGRTLLTSPDHKFLTWGESDPEHGWSWVRQDDLTPDSWVAVNAESLQLPAPRYTWKPQFRPQQGHLFEAGQTPHNYKGFSIDGNSETLWEFLGMVCGDGSIGQDHLIVHCGEAPEWIESDHEAERFARKWVDRLNRDLDVGAVAYLNKRNGEDTRRPTWQIKVCNAAFRQFCREVLGVEDQNTYTKRFPAAVWRESFRHRAVFLRGYFSADGSASATGDTASVRSVNQGLLKDTQALLHSIGIRASYRPKSLRVSVLDRLRFREVVGYSIDYKSERLANLEMNPWIGQWHKLPPGMIQRIGQFIYESSIYSSLPREEKSAVLRLKVGSGSKPQCLKYLQRLPEEEVPEEIWGWLQYDWETPTAVEDLGTSIGMYDIEVFDDKHAFVCDGVIVHNSSADITKLAMGLIYKECKKRGWLSKVLMTVTIHDELVFEIDTDIVEEALMDVIMPLMSRSTPLLKLRWPVPLTLDCELGFDWTVPWNLTEFQHGKKPWPDEIKEFFPKSVAALAHHGSSEKEPTEQPTSEQPAESPSAQAPPASLKESKGSPSPKGSKGSPQADGVPDLEPGEVFVYKLRKPLRQGTVEALAKVIRECAGRGSHPLEIRSNSGEFVWRSEEVLVNQVYFSVLADRQGL